MFSSKSIRVKLLILILAILVPLALLRIADIYSNLRSKIESDLESHTDLARAISTAFYNHLQEIWITEEIVGTYIIDHPELSKDERQRYLKLVQEKQEGIVRISWLDVQGNVLSSSDTRYFGVSLAGRAYVQEIRHGKIKAVSDLVKSAVAPYTYVIPVAQAIYSNDVLKGIVVAVIDSKRLDQKLPDFKLNNKRYLLIDSSGMLVYCSDMRKTPDDAISLADNPSIKQALQGTLATSLKEISAIDGSRILSVDYPIPNIGWDCRVSAPYDIAVTPRYREALIDVVLLFCSLGASLGVAVLLGHILLRPVSILRSASEKIMKGDYSARTNLKGSDEIGLAAEAFDKMAESIEQWYSVKTQFFTNMSHELKTPLNVIFSSVQLIESYKLSLNKEASQNKVSMQMKIIRQNCYRIMRLINNLIDISRHDSGFLNPKLQNYDMVRLVRDITSSVQRYAEMKGMGLSFVSELESKRMACDPDMIERIMLNLISNAIKFTDKNGTISVNLREDKDSLLISVSDTGIGIPPDKVGLVFDRFKQAEDPCMRNREGSGIGLYLVKAFVEAHGGTISLASEVKKGTTFTIRLPVHKLDEKTDESEKDSLAIKHPGGLSGEISRLNIEFSDIYSCCE